MADTSQFHATDMAVGSVIHGNAPIVSLDFHEEGEFLAAGSSASSLYIINALEYGHFNSHKPAEQPVLTVSCVHRRGECKKVLMSKRHGIGHVAYTHHKECLLVSSTTAEGEHALRYWCIYDNQYLRTFKSHTDQVRTFLASTNTPLIYPTITFR